AGLPYLWRPGSSGRSDAGLVEVRLGPPPSAGSSRGERAGPRAKIPRGSDPASSRPQTIVLMPPQEVEAVSETATEQVAEAAAGEPTTRSAIVGEILGCTVFGFLGLTAGMAGLLWNRPPGVW